MIRRQMPSRAVAMPRVLPAYLAAADQAAAKRVWTWPFVWLCFLVLSFCYELPLALVTQYDRTNPRLFDVATLLGILTVLPIVRRSGPLPVVFRRWAWLTAWFVFCALLWTLLWFPWQEAGRFSLFYAARYVQGLVVLYIAAIIPLGFQQKKILHWLVVVGGVVVTVYAIPEYLLEGGYARPLTEETTLQPPPGAVLSCLGPTYFHVAMFSTLACAMSFALVGYARGFVARSAAFLLGVFTAWPATVCGSRAGLLAVALVFVGAFLVIRGLRSRLAVFGLLVFVVVASGFVRMPTTEDLMSWSRSLERFISLEEREGAGVAERAWLGEGVLRRTIQQYEWQGVLVPLVGAGFYAAPHSDEAGLFYRTGYGIHNMYLFPLEQGGLLGLALFVWLMIACIREIWRMMKQPDGVDKWFAVGAILFAGSLCIVGWGGQVFWRGFGTENFNTLIMLVFILATRRTGEVLPLLQRA